MCQFCPPSHWPKRVHVLKITWATTAKGPEVTPGGSLEGRELQSLAKTGEEKGKVAQRKFNSSRKKVVCLM